MKVGVFYLTPLIRFSNIIHLISKIPVLLQKKKRFDMIKYNPKFETEYVTGFWMPLAWRSTYVGIFKATLKKKGLAEYRENVERFADKYQSQIKALQ